MYEKSENILSATTEVLALYMNLDKRKVSEFENEKIKIMNDYILKNNINFNQKDLKFSSKLKK
jgi:acyl-CoA thioester hydrolase